LGLPLVPGQLDLEIVLGIAQIDQREAVEIESVRRLHPEGAIVEMHGGVEVLNPDHHVNRFGHGAPGSSRRREKLRRTPPAVVVAAYYAPACRRRSAPRPAPDRDAIARTRCR